MCPAALLCTWLCMGPLIVMRVVAKSVFLDLERSCAAKARDSWLETSQHITSLHRGLVCLYILGLFDIFTFFLLLTRALTRALISLTLCRLFSYESLRTLFCSRCFVLFAFCVCLCVCTAHL